MPTADWRWIKVYRQTSSPVFASTNSATMSLDVRTRDSQVRRKVPSSRGSTTSSGSREAIGSRPAMATTRANASWAERVGVVEMPRFSGKTLPNTDSTPAAERCRTSCAPKIRASPAYWSKRSWTRPSSIVSSTLDRRRRPPVRSMAWMRWPQVAAVSPVAAIEVACPRTGSWTPCPASTAPSGARNSPNASGASRGRTHRVSSGVIRRS